MPHHETGTSQATAFRTFLDRDWAAWLQDFPELGTIFGYPGYNDRWTDDSKEGVARRKHHLESTLAELRGFSRERLSERDRMDFDLYSALLEECVRGLPFGMDANPFHFGMPHNLWMPVSQMEGIHLTIADLLALQPKGTVRDLEDIVARLERSEAAIDQNIGLLREGMALGYTAPKAAIHGVPDQVKGLIVADPWKSPFLEPFGHRPTTVAEADWQRICDRAQQAYVAHARPALERFHRFLVEEYLPHSRAEVGVATLQNGKAAYEYLIRWQTTTNLTAEEIHQIGLRELDRIHAEMEEIRRKVGFSGTLVEFYTHLRTDPKFFVPDADTLIERYRALGKRADAGLARLFGLLPRLPYGVDPMPAFKAPSSPAAYYQPGALSEGRPGIFYANTHDLRARPTWEMEDLVLHEAVPGHHLQIAIADELEGMPSFRRQSGYTAFIEGWGLYAETLGEELGFYQDPLSKMGQLIADAWRSVRLVVDTGIHAKGWTRQQAIDFFAANAGRSIADITVEIDRYIVWPGQALAYKIGQLKFTELRRWAEKELGDRFRIRGFHDVLLGEGGLPLEMVDGRVRRWVAQSPAV
jgi:uncharacterized protein (DUF885 family)